MSSATPVVSAVAELDVSCEIVMLDLAAGDQKRPEYLKLNPNGWVPTLVVDGTPMFEAVAIAWLVDHVTCHSMSKGEDACFVTRSAP